MSFGVFCHSVIVIEVALSLFYLFQFQVALGQTRMSLHFLKLQRVLPILLLYALLSLANKLIINRLLELGEILFLVVNTLLKLPLEIIQLTNFMRYSRL